jgi:hypothetical protein
LIRNLILIRYDPIICGGAMTNHEKLGRAIKSNKEIASSSFSYAQVVAAAKNILQNTTKPGIDYATLRFLQANCICASETTISREFFLVKDPRKFIDVAYIRSNAMFKLRIDEISKPTAKPIQSIDGDGMKRILDLAENWCKRDISKEAWEPWKPFGDDFVIDSDRCEPVSAFQEQREQKFVTSDVLRLSNQCREMLNEIWKPIPGRETHTCPDHQHWHCYKVDSINLGFWERWKEHEDYKKDQPDLWWCRSVSDAGGKWSWRENEQGPFATIALALQKAVEAEDHVHAAAICFVILKWGGVDNNLERRNFPKWIITHAFNKTLCQKLVDATKLLIPQSSLPTDVFDAMQFFMDSSSTKIYAALALDISGGVGAAKQDVLIYDGRVAGALGLIARYVCSRLGYHGIPAGLRFPVESDSAGAQNPERNPSCPPYVFPRIGNATANHRRRAEYARIAARYIQAVTGTGPSTDFVIAEQGLFMIGYNVRQRCDTTTRCP